MKTVLITGGIASGKSTVCRYLASKGFPVYDSDSRTKALYDSVPGLREKVEEAIGVPFDRIGIIFSDKEKRESLEAVVYPEVLSDFENWRNSQSCGTVIFESAVALEKETFRNVFDLTVCVLAPLEQRIGRNPKTVQRLSSQSAQQPETDIILENDSTLENLYRQIEEKLICKLI